MNVHKTTTALAALAALATTRRTTTTARPPAALWLLTVAGEELDQVCPTVAIAKREANDLRKMDCGRIEVLHLTAGDKSTAHSAADAFDDHLRECGNITRAIRLTVAEWPSVQITRNWKAPRP